VRGTFAIDHFRPVAIHPEKITDYDNLVYSCATCNSAKGSRHVPDPCRVLLQDDIRVLEDGSIQGDTPASRRLIRILGLNDAEHTEFRLLWLGIIALAARHDGGLYQRLLGFPEELPDLTRLQPPEGNSRPEGVEASHFAPRKRGILPVTY
jgi:hypothetical protein